MAMLSKHTWVMITCILINNNAGMTAWPDQMYAKPLDFLRMASPLPCLHYPHCNMYHLVFIQ